MFATIVTNQFLRAARAKSAIQKATIRNAKEERINARKSNFSIILKDLEADLKESFDGTDLKVYINQSQLNVDFDSDNKAYTTCSRGHENVRVQMRLKSIPVEHGDVLAAWLRKACFGRYKFNVEEIKGDALQIGAMVPQSELKFMFEKLNQHLVPVLKGKAMTP